MRYAIYFTWNDGFEDSFNVDNARERDENIKHMIFRGDFTEIKYCPIYASGEYGKSTTAYCKDVNYELVVIWDTGEKQIYPCSTEAEAEQGGQNMKMAFGKQIAWYGTRPKR